MEEDVQPKKALRSFWESKSPISVVPPQCPSSAEASNSGKKWQVRLPESAEAEVATSMCLA